MNRMKRIAFATLPILLFAAALVAQSAPTGVVASTDALALKYDGSWSAGTHVTQSFDLVDFGAQKTNHFFVQAHQLIAPTPGFSIYAGGATIQPDLTRILAKTNLSPASFQFSATGALGSGVSASGPDRISWLAGANATYRLASNVQWQSLSFTIGNIGAERFIGISSGLSFFFGGAAKAAVNPQPSAAALGAPKAPPRPAMP